MSVARLEQVMTDRVVLIAIAVVVGTIFLAGCGGPAGEAPSSPGARDRTATDKEPSISRGPRRALAYGEQTVAGELGSYC
jgi:hypothetical protein